MHQLDDILVEEAKENPAAFGDLVQRYHDRLYNFLYRMTGNREDAQDLAQEAFLRIYKALHRFRSGSPLLPLQCCSCFSLPPVPLLGLWR